MHNDVRHLAVIPDGNRRWARARGLSPGDGHRAGIEVIGRIAEAAWGLGVEVFTFWWGSSANLTRRDPAEVRVIVDCLAEWLAGPGSTLVARHGARFDAYGRYADLCPELEPAIAAATRAGGTGPRRLCLLMAYDGREEILAAADALGGSGGTAEAFGNAMWTSSLPPVDLLVRTGGEPHLSAGFMLWRIAEAQLAFPETVWPDFTDAELTDLLARFGRVERRFGR